MLTSYINMCLDIKSRVTVIVERSRLFPCQIGVRQGKTYDETNQSAQRQSEIRAKENHTIDHNGSPLSPLLFLNRSNDDAAEKKRRTQFS